MNKYYLKYIDKCSIKYKVRTRVIFVNRHIQRDDMHCDILRERDRCSQRDQHNRRLRVLRVIFVPGPGLRTRVPHLKKKRPCFTTRFKVGRQSKCLVIDILPDKFIIQSLVLYVFQSSLCLKSLFLNQYQESFPLMSLSSHPK